MKSILKFAAVALAAGLLSGCPREGDSGAPVETARDLVGRKCAIVVGSMMGDVTVKAQPGIELEWFNDYNSGVEAVRLGKVAAMPLDSFYARRWAQQDSSTFAVTSPYSDIPWGFFFPKGSPLRDKVNDLLKEMKSSGELDRIIRKWIDAENPGALQLEDLPESPGFTGRAGVFRFATPGDREPISFPGRDGTVGFDIEIARRIARALDRRFELVQVNMGGLVPAVQSGKAEMGGGGIAITAERAEKVDFSDCYFRVPTVFLIRASSVPKAKAIRSAADLKGARVAHMSSDFHRQELSALQSDLVFDPYSEYAFAVESLRGRKIDAISLGKTIAEIWMAKFPGEFRIAFEYADDVCAFLMPKNSGLKSRVDAEVRKMRASGETQAIVRKWLEGAKAGRVPELPRFDALPDGAPVLKVASAAQVEPWCFVCCDHPVGADIEILETVAHRLGMRLQPKVYSWGGMVDCVNAGRCDIANGGIYTNGLRFPTVDTTEKYADERMCVLVRNEGPAGISCLQDLCGRTCADILGTALQPILCSYQTGVVFRVFNDFPSAMEAVRIGKADVMFADSAIVKRWVSCRTNSLRIAFSFGNCPYAFIFPKGSPIRSRFNAALGRLVASGEADRIIRKWLDAPDTDAVCFEPLPKSFTGKGGNLRFATTGEFEPGSFVRNGEIVGFDIDLARQAAAALDSTLEPVLVNMSSIVPSVQVGKTDLGGGCLTPTASRAEKVDFSDVYTDLGFSAVVRKEEKSDGVHATGLGAWFASLGDSVMRTFVTEDRWRMFSRGLGVTLFITFAAAILGTLLAFPVWFLRTSRIRGVSACAKGYIAVMQGTPVLVLLMVLFYIVFGTVDIDGLWVAVIGFSLNVSAYVAEMIRSGVDSVPRGQTEAALALGYRPKRAFTRFVLPQAVRAVLPVYRGELIGLLKSTSIVGYIAICDLTKASDLVRSRTYESFFPILSTAFIYFVLAWILAKTLAYAGGERR